MFYDPFSVRRRSKILSSRLIVGNKRRRGRLRAASRERAFSRQHRASDVEQRWQRQVSGRHLAERSADEMAICLAAAFTARYRRRHVLLMISSSVVAYTPPANAALCSSISASFRFHGVATIASGMSSVSLPAKRVLVPVHHRDIIGLAISRRRLGIILAALSVDELQGRSPLVKNKASCSLPSMLTGSHVSYQRSRHRPKRSAWAIARRIQRGRVDHWPNHHRQRSADA